MMTTIRAIRQAALAVVVAMVFALAAGFAPVQSADAAQFTGTFQSRLTPDAAPASVLISDGALTKNISATAARTTTTIRQVSTVATPTTRRSAVKTTATVSTASTASGTTVSAPVDETARARSILAGYISKYPALSGTTVSFGDANGYQAICYYKSGRIVISTTHTATLERIIGHEIWHVIDWRDNGVIDWGENVPPR